MQGFITGVRVRLTETETGARKGYHGENQLFCCKQTNSVACLAWHGQEGTRHFPSEKLCSYFQPLCAPRPEDMSYTWVFSALRVFAEPGGMHWSCAPLPATAWGDGEPRPIRKAPGTARQSFRLCFHQGKSWWHKANRHG